jgi:hypothetical protein
LPSSPVPKEIRDEVVRELYRQVETMDWELLSARQKNQQYARWIEDPSIGGRLTDFQSAEDARVWLKDGPMKEYARALDGEGGFPEFTTKRLSGPDELVRRALGEDWSIVPGSQGVKPLHCLATDGTATRYVCWGRPGTFRDLVWAAVNKAIERADRPMIVVSLRDGQDVNGEERRRHERIAAHCGVDVRHVHRRLVDRQDNS